MKSQFFRSLNAASQMVRASTRSMYRQVEADCAHVCGCLRCTSHESFRPTIGRPRKWPQSFRLQQLAMQNIYWAVPADEALPSHEEVTQNSCLCICITFSMLLSHTIFPSECCAACRRLCVCGCHIRQINFNVSMCIVAMSPKLWSFNSA